ncbi:MAG TPA: GNAT family N-acetyltransferase [Dongiaceae bacterium]|nr:GNAT family N-acetyltransferase [Dongiaceae bacterium]
MSWTPFSRTQAPALPIRYDGTRLAARLTERLRWRPQRESDLPAVVTIFSHPAVVAHRPDPSPETAGECRQRLVKDLDHWQRHGFGRWALERNGHVIGFGGLTYRDGFAGLNLSYHLHPDHWGQGLASEFAAAAVEIALNDLLAPQVIGIARPVNLASRRVLAKVGFIFARPITYGGHPGLLHVKRAERS